MDNLAHNLPIPRTSLIGRDREVAELRDLVVHADRRLVMLTGVGGCGKTRLALQVASDLRGSFPDGVRLAELASLADDALLPQVVAASVGLLDAAQVSPLDALLAFLGPRTTLLVLDNCEHLIDACALLAEQLLSRCPNVRILATSREPLRLPGEQQWRVRPLEIPNARDVAHLEILADCPAIHLFVDRARASDLRFSLSAENASPVAQICTRLEGIPLALELAAARVRVLSVEEILERLDDCLRLLTGGSRAHPTRQQTLAATLDWSYALLTEPERAVFRRLAVFRGGCPLDLAEMVSTGEGADGADVLDLLTRLADKSLVVTVRRDRTTRFHMLEPVRQYAERCLEAAGEVALAGERHRAALTVLAEKAAAALRGRDQVAWLTRLEHEQDNLRAALRWVEERGDGEGLVRLAGALAEFWEAHGHVSEGRRWLNAALDRSWATLASPSARVRALLGAGRLAFLVSAATEAQGRAQECLELARRIGDRPGTAAALVELGMAYRAAHDFERSRQCLEEGLALYEEVGDRGGVAFALLNLGSTLRGRGDLPEARKLLEHSVSLFREEGNLHRLGIAQALLARTILQEGEPRRATQLLAEALAAHLRIGERFFISYDLLGLATALAAQGHPMQAARLLGATWALDNVHGDALTKAAASTYGPLIDEVRAQLNEADFAQAWAEGQAMSLDQAIQYALAVGESDPAPARVSPAPTMHRALDLLTAREREVAVLIGQGWRTDRQIAERLTITSGTAGLHVRHILEKLGFHSRWQVANWAQAQSVTQPP